MEETKYTYCRICEPGCGIEASVVDGRIEKIAGDPKHPMSEGYLCPRGLATLDIHHDPDRLKYPVKKVGGEWRDVSWKAALDDIGGRLQQIRKMHGNDSVGVYFGNPIAFDSSFGMYLPFAMLTMKTNNFYSAGSQDCNNKFAASKRFYGSPLLHPVPDVDKMDFLLVIGSNPAVSHMSFLSLARPISRLRAIIKRGGRVILIDPRRTETAELLGEHIFIRPDTDIFMLLSMLHVIISEGLYSKEVVNAHAKGFDELEKLAAAYPPERAAEVTGIPADVIETLARDFAGAKNAGVYGSLGINLGSYGTLCYWLIQCLNALTGRLDKRGSMIFCETLVDAAKLQNRRKKKRAARTSRIGGYPAVLGTMPAGIMADEMLTPGKGRIKAMIVISGNPVLTVPDPDKLLEAFGSLELLVCLDYYINETGGAADYVLPCKDFYERWDFSITGMGFNPKKYLNYADPVVEAEGERKDTWIVVHDIIKAAEYSLAGSRAFSAIARTLDRAGEVVGAKEPLSFRPRLLLRTLLRGSGVSMSKLTKSRQGVVFGDHRTGNFFAERIQTPDKKVDLAPPEFMDEAGALEEFFESEAEYAGLKLIGQRQRRTHNSWFHNVESFVKKEKSNRVSINPRDASELGINDGDEVEVENSAGSLRINAKVTEEVMPGVVAIPHGWGHDLPSNLNVAKKYPGVNVNKLMASGPESLEKIAGMAKLTGVRVAIKKA